MSLHLKRLIKYSKQPGPLLLIILDGYGIGKPYEGNAIFNASKPHLEDFFARGLYRQLRAHGPAVGLPSEEDMGNSEVGHNALGAGRIFDQGAKLVSYAIEKRTIFRSKVWHEMVRRNQERGTLHFIGLVSDGNVHSHIKHLFAMLDEAARDGVRSVRVHALLDGRDVDPQSARKYIEPLETKLAAISANFDFDYRIASGGGRMKVTMDRYQADWDIVKRGYDAHVRGIGTAVASTEEAIAAYYEKEKKALERTVPDESSPVQGKNISDQNMGEFVIVGEHGPVGKIAEGDSVICFNFRGDRVIEISRALTEENFSFFDRVEYPDIYYAGMMQYDGDLHIPKHFLVTPPNIDRTISQYLCAEGVTSFAVSETQKYGHVTYFWNGNYSGYINPTLEKYVEIPSDRIEFDQAPEMKAKEITAETIRLLESGKYRFGRVNFPNCDMVGHTGNYNAAVLAVEAVDAAVAVLVEHVMQMQGTVVITADHGNADQMFTYREDGSRKPVTSHTLAPVPFCILDSMGRYPFTLSSDPAAGLANVTATLLNLLGFEAPDDYEPSLLKF